MKLTDLFEAPIADMSYIGDFDKSSSFRSSQDRKLLTNPKAVAKIKSMWKYPEESMFNIILVNHPDGRSEVGLVDAYWIQHNFPRISDQIVPLLKNDQINVIYTGNSGTERVPMTGWVMAHRFGHVLMAANKSYDKGTSLYLFNEAVDLFNNTTTDILKEYYNINPINQFGSKILPINGPALGFLHHVFTFKSAREKNIRNPHEVIYEMLAQYMITGNIKINELPKSFRYGPNYYRFKGDNEDFSHVNQRYEDMCYQIKEFFEHSIGHAEGNIYVM